MTHGGESNSDDGWEMQMSLQDGRLLKLKSEVGQLRLSCGGESLAMGALDLALVAIMVDSFFRTLVVDLGPSCEMLFQLDGGVVVRPRR